jgi:hypothetical protein
MYLASKITACGVLTLDRSKINLMRLFSFVFIFYAHVTLGQFNYTIDQQIPVTDQTGNSLAMPWAGGFNAAQVNTMELNNDGKNDLVVFDRTIQAVRTFLQIDGKYKYAPEYEQFFPEHLSGWLLLRDYNGDGLKDIFTADNLGIRVYRNATVEGEPLQWEHYLFYSGFPGPKSEALLTKATTFKFNLQLNYDDLPDFVDVDGDGDLDIFNPSYSNGSAIEFHKNFSAERYGKLDSLDFELVTDGWGGVSDCGCGSFNYNNEECHHDGGRQKHSGGKSMLAFDEDNDGDTDLLFSELNCNTIFLLRNEGTNESPLVTTATPYPQSSPAVLNNYPAAYLEDLDFDGEKDLIVSPNIFYRQSFQNNFRESVWLYKNTGTTSPVFTTPNRGHFQSEMIDVGENAAPAFFDVDADGDLDLFIGSYANNFRGSIFFYENIGTSSSPQFKLVTEDFGTLALYDFINVQPQFVDLNRDNKVDLAFTATSRFTNTTQLFYFANRSAWGGDFSSTVESTGFFVLPFEPITLTDINADGKPDILTGRQNGAVEYWKNTGAGAENNWTLEDGEFLEPDMSRSYPATAIADLDRDGKLDLLYSNTNGSLSIRSNFKEESEAIEFTDFVFSPVLNAYSSQRLGGRLWPAIANIFRLEKPAIIVGNTLGGLHILKPDNAEPLPPGLLVDVYPNPVAFTESIVTIRVELPAYLQLVTQLGQQIGQTIAIQPFQEYSLQLPALKGIYVLRFYFNGKTVTRKIVVN